MGLDITAYSNLVRVRDQDDEGDYDYPRETSLYAEGLPQEDGLTRAIYRVDGERYGFRAGSYSGYNRWREILSLAVLGVPPETVWDARDEYKDKPCFSLIAFSDCEGVIGPVTSAKLATEMTENRAKFVAYTSDEYDLQRYDDWVKAFTLASANGAVSFH
jgi:hypothetical protein